MSFFKTVCSYVDLKPTALSTYTGETVRPLGEAFVHVQHSGWQRFPPLLVAEGREICLIWSKLAHGCEPRFEKSA